MCHIYEGFVSTTNIFFLVSLIFFKHDETWLNIWDMEQKLERKCSKNTLCATKIQQEIEFFGNVSKKKLCDSLTSAIKIGKLGITVKAWTTTHKGSC